MSSSAIWQIIRPHVPLIRFRKGALSAVHDLAVRAPAEAPSAPSPAAAPLPPTPALPMQEWELPRRYQRQILSVEEMDAINSGGAY